MSDCTYHVTCVHADKPHEERKKKLQVADAANWREAALSLFDIPTGRDVIVQIFDDEFQDWIDLDASDDVPQKGKLRLTVCSGKFEKLSLYFFTSKIQQ